VPYDMAYHFFFCLAHINAPGECAVAEVGGSEGVAWQLLPFGSPSLALSSIFCNCFDGFASLLPPSQVPSAVNAQCNMPDLLVDEAFLG